ncbi:hypothetical protein AVEN_154900-1 [Araneus ventricosus]|uniref:Uncharacterized protein n=1 Tax=Araneus ventricosus TaxID=182803 RepID=A0A4Y2A8B9_ARAVE|nr:hypothetical protein AVEN_154900-1 [Araneus ventricosus]
MIGATYQVLPSPSSSFSHRHRNIGHTQKAIINWLAMADFFAASGILLRSAFWLWKGDIVHQTGWNLIVCAIFAIWIRFFYTATYMWTLFYAIDVYLVCKQKTGNQKVYHAVTWVISLGITTVGLGTLYLPEFNAIASNFSCGGKKTANFAAFGIAPYLENLLQENLSKKNFVLLFDESLNMMRQEKQMDIHVRYWHQNRVSTIYFNSVFLGNSRSSDIFEEFISAIAKLKFSKTIQISMDGPNVNWKFYSMLQDYYLRNLEKTCLILVAVVSISCIMPSRLCVLQAHGELCIFLTSLYYLFKNSPARRDDFLKESEGALPKKFIEHRWLENVPASESAINLLPSIKKYIVSVDKGEHNQPNCIASHVPVLKLT